MNEYDFTLVLEGVTDLTGEIEDRLFEAGCDDATISMRQGLVHLTFFREAASFRDAVISAIKNVAGAKIGAVVLRVDEQQQRSDTKCK